MTFSIGKEQDLMDYETLDRQPNTADRPAEEPGISPQQKKKRRLLIWGIAVLLTLLIIGCIAFLLRDVTVHIERDGNSFSLVVGKSKPEHTDAQHPDSVDPAAYLGTEHEIAVSPSAQSAPNTPTSAPGALSLQEIYARSQPSLVSLAAARQRGTVFSTAVILSEDGYLLTNAKNIERAASLFVTLESGEMLEAALVGVDSSTDLAVLKIAAEKLTPAVFGDSDVLRVGDLAVSISSPLSSGSSAVMTYGIISAINPPIVINEREISLLRTSAVTGNRSGGPIFNCYGQIVGLSTTRLDRGYSASHSDGMGLMIPTSAIKTVVDELFEKGYVSGRPTIGVTVEELPDRARIYYGLPSGVYVTSVQAGSGAENAGIRIGDIITALGDRPITDSASLEQLRNNYAPGDVIELTIYRDGHYYTIAITLI